ncbi:hypothetical protein Tco_1370844 [Tanacetum coccineum]
MLYSRSILSAISGDIWKALALEYPSAPLALGEDLIRTPSLLPTHHETLKKKSQTRLGVIIVDHRVAALQVGSGGLGWECGEPRSGRAAWRGSVLLRMGLWWFVRCEVGVMGGFAVEGYGGVGCSSGRFRWRVVLAWVVCEWVAQYDMAALSERCHLFNSVKAFRISCLSGGIDISVFRMSTENRVSPVLDFIIVRCAIGLKKFFLIHVLESTRSHSQITVYHSRMIGLLPIEMNVLQDRHCHFSSMVLVEDWKSSSLGVYAAVYPVRKTEEGPLQRNFSSAVVDNS